MGVIHEQAAVMKLAIAREFAKQEFDVFVTLDFVKALKGAKNTRENCDEIVDSFHRSLSKACCVSRMVWRRNKPQIKMAGSVELSKNARLHSHLLMKRPSHLNHGEFEAEVKKIATGNPWILNGRFAVDYKKINLSDDDRLRRYVTKDISQVIWRA